MAYSSSKHMPVTRPIARALSFLAILLILQHAAGALAASEFHVKTGGDDANPGSESRPFATIAQARDAIRRLPRPLTGDITVWIDEGTYAIAEPLVFGPEDSGTTACAVTYQALPGRKARISGGRRLTGARAGWVRHSGNIWKAQVAESDGAAWDFRYLWADGRRLIRAREPNQPGMWKVARVSPDFKGILLNRKIPAEWRIGDKGVELVLETEWTNARDVIEGVEDDWLQMKTTVGLVENEHVCAKPGNRAFLENAFEFLDQPGEWYLDRAAGTLYCCLAAGADPNAMEIIAPVAGQLLRVAGTREQPVMNLHFKGLEFAHSDWRLPAEGYSGIQACYYGAGYYREQPGKEWPGYMMPNAVQFEYARGCGLERCTVRSVAGSGIGLAFGCLDNVIQGCEVADTAAHGVHIGWIAEVPKAGWHYWWSPRNANRQPWHVNRRNTIADCTIHDTGQELWEGVGLIDMFSQATRVVRNEIAHTGSAGMVIGFCWEPNVITPQSDTLIEHNDVHHYCEKLGDNGGIYTLGRNPNAVMRANFVHHSMRRPAFLESPAYGIYLDQASEGWLVERNVLYHAQAPGFARHWNEPVNIHTLLPDARSNIARGNFIHAHDAGMFCYFDTPAQNLAEEGNVTLSDAADLARPEVREVIGQAGPAQAYRDAQATAHAARLRHHYKFDDSRDYGLDTAGTAPIWLDHGPYDWPAGVTGQAGDGALGLSGAPGVYAAIDYEFHGLELGERFSVAMFIKPENKPFPGNMQGIFSNFSFPGPRREGPVWLRHRGFLWTLNGFDGKGTEENGGMLAFETCDGASQTIPRSAAGAVGSGDGWHHVAAVVNKNAGRVRCYVDGVQVIDSLTETFFDTGRTMLTLGSIDRNHNFKGAMDEVRIYEGLLSEANIRELAGAAADR